MPGLEYNYSNNNNNGDGDEEVHNNYYGFGLASVLGLMSDGVASEQVKKFFFTSSAKPSSSTSSSTSSISRRRNNSSEDEDDLGNHDDDEDSLEIYIPELLQAHYSFYTWPSAPVLAWYLWEHRKELPGKRVLELGSGTALPGIVASKCGALVTLSDSATLPKSLQHLRRSCELNGVLAQVKVVGITWGLFLSSLFKLGPLDLILGSDCFYDPSVFEDIVVTVAFLLERNSAAKFLCTYQERSADWSIEHLLNKWGLTCQHIPLDNLGAESGLDVQELMQDHTIHLLEIKKA
ncbi:methyltransferase-like protein 23 isoform X2 [Copidosoma floridanum]|uniref:methyltransferase-like protein 23 isoform X2 n=1 Tax=Copidosoma floridanum TaxID=29053 RepID=UPI000C6F5806|nr:methyltransferase-like protein 23 isoform X2 [Copidosoma floridanum]